MQIDIKCQFASHSPYSCMYHISMQPPSKFDVVYFHVRLKMKPEKVVGSLLNLFFSSADIPWRDKRWYIHHKTIQLARNLKKYFIIHNMNEYMLCWVIRIKTKLWKDFAGSRHNQFEQDYFGIIK